MLRDLNLIQKLKEQTKSRTRRLKELQVRKQRAKSVSPHKRTSSAEDSKSRSPVPSISNSQNETQHKDLINSKEVVKNNLEKEIKKRSSNSLERNPSPTMSILKSSQSPRPPKSPAPTNEKKQVKFDSKEKHHHLDKADETEENKKSMKYDITPASEVKQEKAPQLDLNWIISIAYEDSETSAVHAIRTIENFDQTLKNIDNKTLKLYDNKVKVLTRQKSLELSADDEKEVVIEVQGDSKLNMENIENEIFVFECKKWLAKDMEDKKIKRNLKVTNILKTGGGK